MLSKEVIREYLLKNLRMLHLENQGAIDILDCAVLEGSIVQLEMAWKDLLGEDPPSKENILKQQFGLGSKSN